MNNSVFNVIMKVTFISFIFSSSLIIETLHLPSIVIALLKTVVYLEIPFSTVMNEWHLHVAPWLFV